MRNRPRPGRREKSTASFGLLGAVIFGVMYNLDKWFIESFLRIIRSTALLAVIWAHWRTVGIISHTIVRGKRNGIVFLLYASSSHLVIIRFHSCSHSTQEHDTSRRAFSFGILFTSQATAQFHPDSHQRLIFELICGIVIIMEALYIPYAIAYATYWKGNAEHFAGRSFRLDVSKIDSHIPELSFPTTICRGVTNSARR